jgi:DNA-binding transcriptional regulator YiaG
MDGSQVKEIRKLLHLTQEEFAHRLGVTLCTVNRWENAKTIPSRLAKKQIQQFIHQEGLNDGEFR